MRILALAAMATLAALAPATADAQPGHHGVGIHRDDHRGPGRHVHHRERVCRMVGHGHHRVRRCTYR